MLHVVVPFGVYGFPHSIPAIDLYLKKYVNRKEIVMNHTLDFTGPRLRAALTEQPSLTLEFYSYGMLLRKRDGDSIAEYPVDPGQIALALAASIPAY